MSDSRPRTRTLRNVVSNWGAFAFAGVINFVLSPFVVHSLGDRQYGVWVLLGSLVGYLGLLDLGVRGAVTRYIASYQASGKHDAAGQVASAAVGIFAAAGVIAIGIGVGLGWFVPKIFDVPADLATVARTVIAVSAVTVAVSLVGGVFGGIVVGLQRFDLNNTIEVVIEALRAAAIYVTLSAGYGLVALALVQLGAALLRGLAGLLLARRLYPALRLHLTRWTREHFNQIVSFGVSSTLLQAAGILIYYSDSLVIGLFLPVSFVTFFAIASNLTTITRSIISGISHIATPMASALQAQDQTLHLQNTLIMGGRTATFVTLPIVVTFMVRGGTFIGLWMGPSYVELSSLVLVILSLSLWFMGGRQVVSATMIGLDKHRPLIPALGVEALINLGLSILLLPSLGIAGVAWGTTIPSLIATLVFFPWYVRRVLAIPIRHFTLNVWLRPTLAMIPFAVGSFVIESVWQAESLIVYFTQVALTLPLAAAGIWILCLTDGERHQIVRRLELRRAWQRG